MPRFRPLLAPSPEPATPLTLAAVRLAAAEVLRPAHFFLGPTLSLEAEHHAAEENVWEIFRGHLLDPAHTRQQRTFEAWNVYLKAGATPVPPTPLLALKLDAEAGQIHVVRGLDRYTWEGYDAGNNVYLSRERRRWVREYVASVSLADCASVEELRDELIALLFLAVVGVSRLPLSSVEAPLPAFSFGELFYCYRRDAAAGAEAVRSCAALVEKMLTPDLGRREQARLLEAGLRAAADVEEVVAAFAERWALLGRTGPEWLGLMRTLFNEVSLSPYTGLVERALRCVALLEERGLTGPEHSADFLSWLLRQVGRHLTAYDLITFHHRGANYPDALLIDAVLKSYLSLIERRPDLFAAEEAGRRRRRALRQGWLLRRRYEGHAVPDLPTSPGENQRVLPASHPRVPEEQIVQPGRRRRRLFADDPLMPHLGAAARGVLRQSFLDLEHGAERRELGMALFLDRPFGGDRAPGEPDSTLLLASVAYSRSVARERLRFLASEEIAAEVVDEAAWQRWEQDLDVIGLPLDAVGGGSRPGAVALADARLAAPDFVLLHTTAGSVAALLERFDFGPLLARVDLRFLTEGRPVLVARAPAGPAIQVYDAQLRRRLELEVAPEGAVWRAGQEEPRGGLLARCWDADGKEQMPGPLRLPRR